LLSPSAETSPHSEIITVEYSHFELISELNLHHFQRTDEYSDGRLTPYAENADDSDEDPRTLPKI